MPTQSHRRQTEHMVWLTTPINAERERCGICALEYDPLFPARTLFSSPSPNRHRAWLLPGQTILAECFACACYQNTTAAFFQMKYGSGSSISQTPPIYQMGILSVPTSGIFTTTFRPIQTGAMEHGSGENWSGTWRLCFRHSGR
jgi:hypothetical protein